MTGEGGETLPLPFMEILQRAKDFNAGEIVPSSESQKNVEAEVHHRTHKAGYTDRDGQPITNGKGDSMRPCNRKKYRENYIKIFGE